MSRLEKVYIAGPLSHLRTEEATGWRRAAAKAVSTAGYVAVDPGLASVESYASSQVVEPHGTVGGIPPKSVWMNDIENGVLSCAGMLAGFPQGGQTSLGVGIEVGAAYMAGLPIAFWIPPESAPPHIMLQALINSKQATVHDSLGEAAAAVLVAIDEQPPVFEAMLGRVLLRQRSIMLERQLTYGPYNIANLGLHGVLDRAQQDKLSRIEQDHRRAGCMYRQPCKVDRLGDHDRLDAYVDAANYLGPISLSLMFGWWGKDGCPPLFSQVAG